MSREESIKWIYMPLWQIAKLSLILLRVGWGRERVACWTACAILVPEPGIELMSPALEARSLNHWTPREGHLFLHPSLYLSPLQCDFIASPIRGYSWFSNPWNMGWPCDLLWPRKCSNSKWWCADSKPMPQEYLRTRGLQCFCLPSWNPAVDYYLEKKISS